MGVDEPNGGRAKVCGCELGCREGEYVRYAYMRSGSRRLICVAGYGYRPWIRESMGTLSGGQSSRSIVLIRRRGTLEHIRDFVPQQGLNRMDLAVDAWEHALGALPTENLSPIERKQKDQYSSELAAAKAKFEDEKANPKRWGEAMQLGAGDVDKLP